MARTISDENIKLNIIINGNQAQKELLDVEKATRKYEKANKDLRLERKKVEKELGKSSKEYKALSAEIKSNNTIIAANKTKMQQLQKQIGITGLTMSQLKKRASLLRMQLMHTIPGGEKEKAYRKELFAIQTRLSKLSLKAKTAKFSISGIANGFNKYAALGASAIAATTGLVLGLQKMIDYNGKLSDSQADVMKTTGMTKEEVDELTKSFGILNTRTSRMDLLKIAEEGGRIGIAKNEISDFVAVMNKANVALGDSFEGGPEEVASKLGKLKLLFKETKDIGVEKAYESIGSAINELGANGVATETNIANFATRVGSLPNALKPSIQDALGLGAAFEESGVQAEISGRSYAIFLGEAAKKSEEFAKVMGISKKEVEDLIDSDPTEFFLQFSEKLEATSKGGVDTAKTLQKLGLSANGVKKIVGAAGNNVGRFRELLQLSNKSMVEGTSLTKEYDIKNNNLAATLDKVKKKMFGWFSSEGLIAFLTSSVTWIAKFIGATEDADGSVTKWKAKLISLIRIIAIAVVGFTSYNTAIKLAALWQNGLTASTHLLNIAQKANALSGGTLKAVYLGLQYGYYTLTLQTNRATIAQNAFNVATKLNPIGLIIGLLTAGATAYFLYNKELSETAKNQNTINDLQLIAKKSIVDEISQLNNLLIIARDETQSKKDRLQAIEDINKISPEFLKNISLETINTIKAKEAIDDYILSLEKKSMKEAFAAKRTEVQKQLLDAKSDKELSVYGGFWEGPLTNFKEYYELEQKKVDELTENEKNIVKRLESGTIGWNSHKMSAYREYKQTIQDAKNELIFLNKEEKEFIENNASLYVSKKGDDKNPKEGDVKYIGDVKFLFSGGKWVKQNGGGGNGDEDLTEEDKQVKRSKENLAEFIKEWNNNQRIQKTLREEEDISEEQLKDETRILAKYDKMASDAHFTSVQAAGLEEMQQQEIDAVKQKWSDKRLADKKKEDAKFKKLDAKQKKALLKAEEDLERAKQNALNAGVGFLGQVFGRKNILYKAMFTLEKALAIQEILINNKKANAQIVSNLGIANMKAIAASPMTGGLPMTAFNTAQAAKSTLTNNLNTGANVAGILASVIAGFEEGFYPVQRQQDGKMFNAQFGGNTQSGMVSKPTVFMAGENGPELIIDSKAYQQMSPDIRNSMHREIARVKGFESGFYQAPQQRTEVASNGTDVASGETNVVDSEMVNALNRASAIFEKIEAEGIEAYISNDLKNGKRIKKLTDNYEKFVLKNKV